MVTGTRTVHQRGNGCAGSVWEYVEPSRSFTGGHLKADYIATETSQRRCVRAADRSVLVPADSLQDVVSG